MSDSQETPATTEVLNERVAELEQMLTSARERMQMLSERNDEHISNWRSRYRQAVRISESRFEYLKKAMQDAYGESDKFDHTHSDVRLLIRGALRVTALKGLLSDGSDIADALGASDLWTIVREDNDYSHQGLSSEQIREKVDDEVLRTLMSLEHHPLDPRFSEVWERATRLAQEKNLCEQYDSIAALFDIPTDHEFDFEGTVEVEFSGRASIPVSGRATRLDLQNGEAGVGAIDTDDILEHADLYSLDWSIYETDVRTS